MGWGALAHSMCHSNKEYFGLKAGRGMNSAGSEESYHMCSFACQPEDQTKTDSCRQQLQIGNGYTVTCSVNTPSQGESLLLQSSPWPLCSHTQVV